MDSDSKRNRERASRRGCCCWVACSLVHVTIVFVIVEVTVYVFDLVVVVAAAAVAVHDDNRVHDPSQSHAVPPPTATDMDTWAETTTTTNRTKKRRMARKTTMKSIWRKLKKMTSARMQMIEIMTKRNMQQTRKIRNDWRKMRRTMKTKLKMMGLKGSTINAHTALTMAVQVMMMRMMMRVMKRMMMMAMMKMKTRVSNSIDTTNWNLRARVKITMETKRKWIETNDRNTVLVWRKE